ncbi:paired amphipathic helix protein Sin3a isoform X2 [Toxorhynchites rutilus septentrionalis]|uniref:paired amphipathic helix protein Sin3a isoform X2 n=1 Tax=Toxorhynchites rutilus septentrionalis TaxID=329112 RepID=UPI00247A3182|nr:paired amphipathic helix protein Sin3a isoform X2 [Toxorhynchites rutilus septentrionalis]
MKRGRTEEIQFGQQPPRASGTAPLQRLITTTQPHNAGGSTIQYQISPNVIKTTTPADVAANLSQPQQQQAQQQQQLQAVPQQQVQQQSQQHQISQQSVTSQQQQQQQQPSVQYTATSYATSIGGGGPNVVKTAGGLAQSAVTTPQQPAQQQVHVVNTTNQVRGGHKGVTNSTTSGSGGGAGQVINTMPTNVIPSAQPQPPPPPPQAGQAQFQRLKVEDALSYLDQVKFRFGNQPQVYNDFLDIMKEFKSQSIDTPGVIQRVSNLFKGHPELIVGFNTFLPPGYKIEVQANDQGYAFQVSVSVPSTSSGTAVAPQPSPHKYSTIFQGGGQIVQTPNAAVNLMSSYGHSTSSVHSTLQSVVPASVSGTQNSNVTNIASIPQSPQNFSRDRERTISGGSGGPNLPSSNASIGPVSSADPSTINSSQQQNIHRMISQQVIPHQQQQSNPPEAPVTNSTPNQPVEFNHAITYVNKIKNRFHSQPEKYKRFLEILHTYQKEQKIYKEGPQGGCNPGAKQLTEAEVYTQVAKLFDNQEDLLREFGQFLPDATSHAPIHVNKNHTLHEQVQPPTQQPHNKKMSGSVMSTNVKPYNSSLSSNLSRMTEREYAQCTEKDYIINSSALVGRSGSVGIEKESRNHVSNQKFAHNVAGIQGGGQSGMGNAIKRSPSFSQMPSMSHNMPSRDREGPPIKRHKPICRDITLSEASKFGTLNDYAFFDKVRKALKSPEVYENFLRCLTLFNQEIVSKSELLTLVTPFLSRFPDLLKWFQDFLGPSTAPECIPLASAQRQDRSQSELATDIDLSTCKRLGASYCALPKSHENVKCSGRTNLCRDVLNDTWVSFPTWAEDSTFVTSRKTQYEEFIYRCEDERFELDVVIETNSATIRVLEGVQKKLSRMSPDEVSRFRLDDCLGGTSPTIHQRALRRIYGDKAADIIQGLKKNPFVAVPVVLRRLKAKEEEWREAQKGFNKQWREQNEKYYLKSLDHQGINFKQNDIKALRSKSLFNEIETLFDERHEQSEDGSPNPSVSGPHLILPYKDKTILDDATNLLIHHVKRQTGIQKQEKARIKHILRQFVPDLFFAPRQQLSDDEREDDDRDMDADQDHEDEGSKPASKSNSKNNGSSSLSSSSPAAGASSAGESKESVQTVVKEENLDSGNGGNASGVKTPSNAAISADSGTTGSGSSMVVAAAGSQSSLIGSGDSSASANRDSTDDNSSSKDNNMPDGAIKVEIKQENDPDQPVVAASQVLQPQQQQQQTNSSLPTHARHMEEAYTLFFTNNNWYLFLRLHAILCERLRSIYERAQIIATEEKAYQSTRNNSTATALRLKPKSEIKVEDFYSTFLDMLKNVLDGNMEASNFEDSLREMFGIHAYIAFTLDRVVQNAVRQLQHCVTERGALECVELFLLEQRKGGAGGLCRTASRRVTNELTYQRKAEAALQDENCFKIYVYKMDCRVTIELLDTESEDTAQSFNNAQNYSNYVDRLSNPAATGTGSESGASTIGGSHPNMEIKTEKLDDNMSYGSTPRKALFLQRNLRRCKVANQPPATELSSLPVATKTEGVDGSVSDAGTPGSTRDVQSPLACAGTTTTTNIGQKTNNSVSTIAEVVGSNNNNNNKKIVGEEGGAGGGGIINNSSSTNVWNNKAKAPPERLPSSNGDQNYYVDDREQFRLNVNNYKICYVLNKDHIFYKRKSLIRAKETHQTVTRSMHRRFDSFIKRWLDRNVSDSQRVQCNEWLMGNRFDLVKNVTVVKQNNDISRTPYMLYNRYKVEKLDSNQS